MLLRAIEPAGGGAAPGGRPLVYIEDYSARSSTGAMLSMGHRKLARTWSRGCQCRGGNGMTAQRNCMRASEVTRQTPPVSPCRALPRLLTFNSPRHHLKDLSSRITRRALSCFLHECTVSGGATSVTPSSSTQNFAVLVSHGLFWMMAALTSSSPL